MQSYYHIAIRPSALRKAWRKVFENGLSSKSRDTQDDVRKFAEKIDQNIDKIYRPLLRRKFSFLPAKGIAKRKVGKKKPRPIVVAPIPNRIVQRSLLNALHTCEKLREYENIPTSFGGIEGRGVPHAIQEIKNAIKDGYAWFIRSDISDFFTGIPRDRIMEIVNQCIPEPEFLSLFQQAIKVELENLGNLGEDSSIFPLEDGVAQGCCLSPLLGNILLNDFDKQMNGRGVICLRYIDDFIVLGRNEPSVKKAFENGLGTLQALGLKIHTPDDGSGKASMGMIQNGVNFLGCEIRPGNCRPDSDSQKRLLAKIEQKVNEAIFNLKNKNGKSTYLSMLMDIHQSYGVGANIFFL
jgi:RNA-directed DNA polymerase